LCGAEPFGFGPCSKLTTILNFIKRLDVSFDFYGKGSAYVFFKQNVEEHTIRTEEDISKIDQVDYDAVISVMDWEVAAWGYFNNVPVYFFDSLYWCWNWPQSNRSEIEKKLSEMRESSLETLIDYLVTLPNHLQIYAAHYMATKSYIQYYPQCLRNDGSEETLNPIVIQPMVDLTLKREEIRDTILISLSGLQNPLLDETDIKRYVELICELTRPVLDMYANDYKVVWAVNEEMISIAEKTLGVEIHPINQKEFLEFLNKTAVLLAPAGITTIYETIFYETPIIILPEQHNGHFKNYQNLHSNENIKAIPQCLINHRLQLQLPTDPLEHTKGLFEIYYEMLLGNREELVKELQQELIEQVGYCTVSHENRKIMVENQKKIIFSDLREIKTYQDVLTNIFTKQYC